MKKFKCIVAMILCVIFGVGGLTASANTIQSSPYQGYEYNSDNVSVPAPIGYEVKKTVKDSDFSLTVNLGKATAVDYDGTDVENPFGLINFGNKIAKTDADFNIVSYYSIKDKNGKAVNFAGKKIVFNVQNGYAFLITANGLEIYNSNSDFIKKVTASDVELSGFSPKTVLHVGDGIDNYIYVLSDNNCVVLDSQGEFVENIVINSAPLDIYYSTATMCLYALAENKIINVTEETETPIAVPVNSNSKLIADLSGMTYYVLCGNEIYQIDSSSGDVMNVIKSGSTVKDITYNTEKDWITVLTDKGNLNIDFYVSDGYVKSVNNYNIRLNNPQDIIYKNDSVYILDSGNARILKTDTSCTKIEAIYESFIYGKNEKLNITDAQGFWIDNDKFYIADTENERVLVTTLNGNVEKILIKPESLEQLTSPFKATKVLTDREGNIYVIAESVNMGAFVFSKDYEYKNFFGSNTVATTAEAIYNYMRKKFLNKEQRSSLQSFTPITLANFDIDKEGFIYIVTETDNRSVNNDFTGMIRKVNYLGSDILESDAKELLFGDLEWDRQLIVTNTSFSDIDVNDSGWIVALDSSRGKLFEYSANGEYITSFGGLGEQDGFFKMPSAIENIGESVYVLDAGLNSITVFQPTDYGDALHEAFLNMNTADLDTAVTLWNRVLDSNSNNIYAYYGLGIAYENAGNYEEAMRNFKIANAKEQYSKAFREYRKDYINDNIIVFVLIIAVAITAIILVAKWLSKMFVTEEGQAYSKIESKYGMPLYVLLHPSDGFSQFRTRGLYSIPISIGIVIAFFLTSVLQFFKEGFIFNENKPINYNLLVTIGMTIGIYFVFAVSNLAISTFMDGKGTFKHIISTTSYAMIPMILAMLINIGLSNVLTLDESVFMSIILAVGYIWSGIVLLVGMMTIHEYSMTKTIVSLIFTVVAMIIFAVVAMLMFTLIQQVINFIDSMVYEIGLR